MINKKFYIFILIINTMILKTQNLQKLNPIVNYVYRNHIFQASINTDGWGIGYEYQFKKLNPFYNIIGINLGEKKHPKEERVYAIYNRNSFSFIYGKQNICYPIQMYYARKYNLGIPNEQKGVEINLYYRTGLSIAFLRPYYITIKDTSINNNLYSTVNLKYSQKDSLYFFSNNNYVDSPYFLGLNEIKPIFGFNLGASLEFDFGNKISKETSMGLKVTALLEYYLKDLDIMVQKSNIINQNLFISGQITVFYGIKNKKIKK